MPHVNVRVEGGVAALILYRGKVNALEGRRDMKNEVCGRHVSEYMNPATPVVSLRTSVQEALRLVRDHGISALPVCEDGRFLGVVKEKDLLAMTPSEATSLSRFEIQTLLDKVTVGRIMKSPPATIAPDLPLCDAAAIMVRNSSDVLPVVDQDKFAGFITWVDMLDAALETCS